MAQIRDRARRFAESLPILCCLLAAGPVASVAQEPQSSYAARTAYAVEGGLVLELDLDQRLPGADCLALERKNRPPLLNARIRLLDRAWQVLDSKVLDRPCAELTGSSLPSPSGYVWLLTVDYSAGMGSYNGPITFPLAVHHRKLSWLFSIDRAGKRRPIALMRSNRTDWQVFPSEGTTTDVLHLSCRPVGEADGGVTFFTTYERLHFDGLQWRSLSRKDPGDWEGEDGFPSRERFP